MAEELRVLLVGSGGREHALAWALAKSKRVTHVFVAPGNGGTASGNAKISNVAGANTNEELVAFAKQNNLNLVVIGPEQPLVSGLADLCKQNGLPCFGPSKKAARLEGSKAFSKDFMARHKIPTAAYKSFTNVDEAVAYISGLDYNVVVKASGLAAGKGVIIPANKEEAIKAVKEIMVDKIFGDAGSEVVVEEMLDGPEVSVFAFSDGYTVVPLPASQDHKRAYDNDQGPNTGGMGAYCPTPFYTPSLQAQIMSTVLQPTITGLRREGMPYIGLLYVGLMLTSKGPKVLEYNCRGG
eukprot:Colp12_sorted_trinity150504_noHs@23306